MRPARSWHLLTALVAAGAVLLQLVLIDQGNTILDETDPPGPVTRLVHFFLLRPLLDLHRADLVADRLLHVVVPLLAVIGWLAFGPRNRIDRVDLGWFLVLPVSWLVYTLVRGEFVDWYSYPFIDVIEHGYVVVAMSCIGVSVLMLGLGVGALLLDRLLTRRVHTGQRGTHTSSEEPWSHSR